MPTSHEFDAHEAYRTAIEMTRFVYGLEDRFPEDEMDLLFARLRGAAIDVGARLAEGIGRDGCDERGVLSDRTMRDALGALSALRHYVLTAQERFFLDEHQAGEFDALYRKMRAALTPAAGV